MTTSTSSANAATLPDRRHFLSTIAGAGAQGLPALPVRAGAPGPIEAMWPEYLRLEAALDDAASQTMDAEERYEEPPRPCWHPVDTEGGYITIHTSPGRGFCALDDSVGNVACLREMIAREHDPDRPGAGYRNKVRARRARKTLAKIEAWQAEVRERRNAAGLTEAEAAQTKVGAAYSVALDAIFAIEATTFRELAHQAAILDVEWHQERAERVLERLVELAGIAPLTA